MIVRKYTDTRSNLEVSVTDAKTLCFETECDGVYLQIYLSYEDASDLKDQLYNLIKAIEPKKEKTNG